MSKEEQERIKDWFAVIAYHVNQTMLIDEDARLYLRTIVKNCASHCLSEQRISGRMVDNGREVLDKP